VAKPHKKASRSIEVFSDLPADQLAELSKAAADQCKIRLDDIQPGRLIFSVRALFRPNQNCLMTFAVQLATSDGERVVTSHILNYRTTQATVLFFIPFGPRSMPALPAYEKFMERFRELAEHADPDADVVMRG
jgi:hypothetical protein